jgi:hypothetical protein
MTDKKSKPASWRQLMNNQTLSVHESRGDFIVNVRQGAPSIAVLISDNTGMILAGEVERPALSASSVEIPRAVLEEGQDPKQAALDLIKEWTGQRCHGYDLASLGRVQPDAAILANGGVLFRVTLPVSFNACTAGRCKEDGLTFSADEICKAIEVGDIVDAFTIAAAFRARLQWQAEARTHTNNPSSGINPVYPGQEALFDIEILDSRGQTLARTITNDPQWCIETLEATHGKDRLSWRLAMAPEEK